MTLFHSSILNLAKMFLDPLNNDDYSGNVGINVRTPPRPALPRPVTPRPATPRRPPPHVSSS